MREVMEKEGKGREREREVNGMEENGSIDIGP
jgi:hypothetical protein